MGDQPAREVSLVVSATPQATWDAVTDLRAMSRRSPELVGMWVLGSPRAGRFTLNLNRRGWFFWPTTSRITDLTAPSDGAPGRFAFSVWPTDVEWSYEVSEHADGTLLTERRTAVVDASLVVRATARLALGGQDGHDDELVDGMRATLAAIEADVRS